MYHVVEEFTHIFFLMSQRHIFYHPTFLFNYHNNDMANIFFKSLMTSQHHIIKIGGGIKKFIDFHNRGIKKLILKIGD